MEENDNKDSKQNPFPEEYAPLWDLLNQTKETLKVMEEQSKNLPIDKGPEPQLNPPEFLRSRQTGDRNLSKASLEKQMTQLKAEISNSVASQIKDAKPETARLITDTMHEMLDSNPYKEMDEQELEKQKNQIKDIEKSQDFSDTYLKKAKRNKSVEEKKEKNQFIAEKEFSMSGSFSQSLNYSKLVSKVESTPDKEVDKLPEKDKLAEKNEIDLDRD